MDQTHVSHFFAEVSGNFSEVLGEAQSDSPGLVFSSLYNERHDESFVLISIQNFGNFLEAFSGKNSDLILFIGGSVFEDADEVAQDIFFFVDSAHLRYLGGGDSL